MANFLITGGAGFVGSNLANKLADNPENRITIVDSLLTGKLEHLPQKENVKFIKADVNVYRDIEPIMTSQHFDYVYHYAAVAGVQRTLQHPLMVLEDVKGFENILSLAKSTGVTRVLYSSSSEVYGEPVEIPLKITSPLNARLPYAVVKNIGECFLRSYHQEHGLEYTIFRFFNTYGPHQSSDYVMSRFIDAALNNEDIPVYGDGSQTRSFCFVNDNVEATIKALTDPSAVNETINIGNDIQTTVLELAEVIIKLTGSKSKIVHLPPLKEGDMKRRQPDAAQMKQLLGRDLLPLEEGIKKLVDFKKNGPSEEWTVSRGAEPKNYVPMPR